MIVVVAAGNTVAVTPHPALPAKLFAGFAPVPGQSGPAETGSYKVSAIGTVTVSDGPAPSNWGLIILGFAAIGFASRTDARKFAHITF